LLTANASARIFNASSLDVPSKSTRRLPVIRFAGNASFQVGSGDIGVRADLAVSITNYAGSDHSFGQRVGWDQHCRTLGWGQCGFSAGVSTEDGLMRGRGLHHDQLFSLDRNFFARRVTVHVNLRMVCAFWLSDIANASVYLDAIHNGVRDANEPETVSDADGNFTFGLRRY